MNYSACLALEIERLRALNAELIQALEQIVDLAHYPDESIARHALDRARLKMSHIDHTTVAGLGYRG